MTSTIEQDVKRRRFFAWKRQHPSESEDTSAVWNAAWEAGAWDAIRRNTTLGLNLSDMVQRLEELAAMYRDVEIEREIEQGAYYWHDQVDDEPDTEPSSEPLEMVDCIVEEDADGVKRLVDR